MVRPLEFKLQLAPFLHKLELSFGDLNAFEIFFLIMSQNFEFNFFLSMQYALTRVRAL